MQEHGTSVDRMFRSILGRRPRDIITCSMVPYCKYNLVQRKSSSVEALVQKIQPIEIPPRTGAYQPTSSPGERRMTCTCISRSVVGLLKIATPNSSQHSCDGSLRECVRGCLGRERFRYHPGYITFVYKRSGIRSENRSEGMGIYHRHTLNYDSSSTTHDILIEGAISETTVRQRFDYVRV